jgi:ribonuclease HII
LSAGSDTAVKTSATDALYRFDRMQSGENRTVIGIDEAGRGPLAGPVVAAAVLLDSAIPLEGVDDSKKLSAKERERLYDLIVNTAHGWAIGLASVEEIDRINILQATFAAMFRAVSGLAVAWDMALVDGNRIVPQLPPGKQKAIVAGDASSASIAAASILAKVTRDRAMLEYHRQYPMYEFHRHKGYGTALHLDRIGRHGLCAIHRRTFCSTAAVQQTTLNL